MPQRLLSALRISLPVLIALLLTSSSRGQAVAEPPKRAPQPAKDSRLMKLAAEGKLTSQILYPMVENSTWAYDMQVQGKKMDMMIRIAGIEKSEKQQLYKVEAAFDGKVSATESFSNDKQGLARHRNNGLELSPPLQLLRNPVKIGDKWQQKIKHSGITMATTCKTSAEVIDTPLGKLDTVKVSISTVVEGVAIDTDYWFAPDVGCVRQVLNLGQVKANMIIREHKPGKAEKT